MQSPTHSLIALALLSKSRSPKHNWVIFAGAAIPDIFIYAAWIWLTFVQGKSQSDIWNTIYFDTPMQIAASLFNSIPLYGLLAVVGILTFRTDWGRYIYLFAAAALIHIAFDFPVHALDAYAYFQPFSEWRFHSPLSYYEADHYGVWVSSVEALIAGFCIFALWRRFPVKWVRVVLGLFAILYTVQMLMTHLAPRLMPS